jgi:hypothetical protein
MDLRRPEEGVFVESGQGDQRQEKALKSPCTKVCVMEPQSGLCRGCYRTLDEIARWGGMTDAEREEILSGLEQRRRDARSDVPEVPVPPLA